MTLIVRGLEGYFREFRECNLRRGESIKFNFLLIFKFWPMEIKEIFVY